MYPAPAGGGGVGMPQGRLTATEAWKPGQTGAQTGRKCAQRAGTLPALVHVCKEMGDESRGVIRVHVYIMTLEMVTLLPSFGAQRYPRACIPLTHTRRRSYRHVETPLSCGRAPASCTVSRVTILLTALIQP